MIKIALLSLLVACSSPNPPPRQNRACILADNALAHDHKEGTCSSVSLGETVDYAILRFDSGSRLCHDLLVPDRNGPLACWILEMTKADAAAQAKATAEADAKAKIDADAKVKAEAEAKARADLAAGAGGGSAKKP